MALFNVRRVNKPKASHGNADVFGHLLDGFGVKAASDLSEFQIPICQAGIQPNVRPAGPGSKTPTEPVYVLIPMFSVDK